MHSEARNPDTARLRLVDLRVDGEHLLHFGGGLSCVLARNGSRTSAAYVIAQTVVGPRPTGSSGAIDIGGTLVSVWSLPSPMLPDGAPVVIDRDLVRSFFAASLAPLRAQLAAAHGVCALDGQRIAGELAALGAGPAIEAVLEEAPDPEPDPESGTRTAHNPDEALACFMEQVQLYSNVESLVAALEPQPMPEAVRLAELIDANRAMARARATIWETTARSTSTPPTVASSWRASRWRWPPARSVRTRDTRSSAGTVRWWRPRPTSRMSAAGAAHARLRATTRPSPSSRRRSPKPGSTPTRCSSLR